MKYFNKKKREKKRKRGRDKMMGPTGGGMGMPGGNMNGGMHPSEIPPAFMMDPMSQ